MEVPPRSRNASPSLQAPAAHRQKEIIEGMTKDVKLRAGQTWYPISRKWYSAWQAYAAGADSAAAAPGADEGEVDVPPDPGPISNEDLLDTETDAGGSSSSGGGGGSAQGGKAQLRRDAEEHYDFVLLPQGAYQQLQGWYGGGPHFPRAVIERQIGGPDNHVPTVELWPLRFSWALCGADGAAPPPQRDAAAWRHQLFSRAQTVRQVRATVLERLGAPNNDDARISVRFADHIFDTADMSTATPAPAAAAAAAPAAAAAEQEEAASPTDARSGSGGGSGGGNGGWHMVPQGGVYSSDESPRSSEEGGARGSPTAAPAAAADGMDVDGGEGGGGDAAPAPDADTIAEDHDAVMVGGDAAAAVSEPVTAPVQRRAPGTGRPPDGWRLVLAKHLSETLDARLGDYQGRVEVLVEVRDPVTGLFPRHAITDGWRDELQPGDLVDAKDNEGKWFESVIVGFNKPEAKEKEVTVHFKGWSSKWDLSMRVHADTLQPLHTYTADWRSALAVGTPVDMSCPYMPASTQVKAAALNIPLPPAGAVRWYPSVVEEVDKDNARALVKVSVATRDEARWVAFDSDDIMPVGTHTSALAGAAGALGTAKKRALPAATSTFSSTSSGGYSWGERGNTVGTPAEPGAVGLHNLGNTCFMNSMLQCLSATGALTAYFKSGGWSVDLNEDNALGADGKMARAYAELVRNLWDGRYTQVAPAALKRVIGEHAPAFAGYQQQDSQELMIFLLDGLHEDLNRVRRKPYVEAVESDGRPDAVVAEDSWRRYLLRNDSVLVDRCHGLLRSHVTCPACNYESITFDAYTCLSLPLPVDTVRRIKLLVRLLPLGSPPLKMVATVPAEATVADLKAWVSAALSETAAAASSGSTGSSAALPPPPPQRLAVADVMAHRVFKRFQDAYPVSEIKDNDTTIVCEYEHEVVARTRSGSVSAPAAAAAVASPIVGPAPPPPLPPGPLTELRGGSDAHSGGGGGGGAQEADILVAKPRTSTYAYGTAHELFALPTRVALPPGATARAVLAIVARQVAGMLAPGAAAEALAAAGVTAPLPHTAAADADGMDVDAETPAAAAAAAAAAPGSAEVPRGEDASADVLYGEAGGGGGDGSGGGGDNDASMEDESAAPASADVPQHHETSGSSGAATAVATADAAASAAAAAAAGGGGGGGDACTAIVPHVPSPWDAVRTSAVAQPLDGGGGGGGGGAGPVAAAAAVIEAEAEEPLYRVYVTDISGSLHGTVNRTRREITPSDEPFPHLKSSEAITVYLSRRGAAAVDEEALTREEEHASVQGAREAEDGSGKRAIPLADCFEKFLEREQLGADNQWYCSSCKEHKQAYKKFDIWTTPDVLILHLKRFQYLPGQYLIHRQKIDDLVQFPVENLDLSDVLRRCGAPVHADAPPVYDLFAVSEHSGTLRGGHYTATARNPLSGKWYGFNDGHVFETATQQAVSPQAYVLFYARRKGALRWGGMPGGT